VSNILKDKIAIITGASSGIGEATARKLASLGVHLVLAARRIEKLQTLKVELEKQGIKILAIKTDVSKHEQVEALIQKTVAHFGKFDILINNAGIMPLGPMKNLRVEEWDQMIDVNLKGVLYGIAAAMPVFRTQKSGHIVNISSVGGRRVYAGCVVYCATKFAVRAISEGLRMELDPKENIRVTVIEPGAVNTDLPSSIKDPEVLQWFPDWSKSFQMLEAEDIAEAIVYSISQANRVNVDEILIMPREQNH